MESVESLDLDKNEFIKFYKANSFNYQIRIFKALGDITIDMYPKRYHELDIPSYSLVDTRNRRLKRFKSMESVFRFIDQLNGIAVEIIYYG
jgi:hypothetical protein